MVVLSTRVGEGTKGAPAGVPAELVGREASARLLTPLLEAAARKGVRVEALVEGTGFSAGALPDRGDRIAWASFMRCFENLGRTMSDAELVSIGAAVLDNPVNRALLIPGRLLLTLPEIYRWGASPNGPLVKLLAGQEMSVTEIDERHLRLETRVMPGYEAVRPFWLTRLGLLQSVPRAFGLPPAKVTWTVTSYGASYDIELPAERGLVSRVRKRMTWLSAARGAAVELQKANDDLHERYVELQREVAIRKNTEDQLRVLNAELELRVRERTAALEAANLDLATSNNELTTFSAAVAHDLRSPLRGISGFAQVLVEDYARVLDAEARGHLDRIVAGAARMGTLIDALLALARLARTEVRREPLDLGEIAHAVADELRTSHPERSVEVAIDEGMTVRGDAILLRALMENLVGNAWKFTRNRATAHIEIARRPDGVFVVRDDGAGFEMRHVDKLFTPFQRLHPSHEFEGTGIGLAIVDRIVRRHGGKIWVDGAPGRGATFSFTLAPAKGDAR